jgi:hypothetical protein
MVRPNQGFGTMSADADVKDVAAAETFDPDHFAEKRSRLAGRLRSLDILGPDADCELGRLLQPCAVRKPDRHAEAEPRKHQTGSAAFDVDHVHGRRADEFGYEPRGGTMTDLVWGADLLDASFVENEDTIGKRHRLQLIMRHVDDGLAAVTVKRPELETKRDAKSGVEIGERFIQHEQPRMVGNGAADGDALGDLPLSGVLLSRSG